MFKGWIDGYDFVGSVGEGGLDRDIDEFGERLVPQE